MSDTAIKVENLSKLYQLGEVGTGTLSKDLNRWWAKLRGNEDPYAKLGQVNDRTKKVESDFVWALKDINFEVKQGEVLGIIGKNGAGKSTLLKILSKITSPTTGKIYTKGRIASLLEVGTGFHPEMTGRENIYLNGAILGMRKWEIEKKFDEIVDFAGVEAYIDTPVKRYSSGMYVRLAFAVAANLECEILIVDEVLAVGDSEFQKKCIGKMSDISKGGARTILFVSHDLIAVQKLCSRSMLLENGRMLISGITPDIINHYFINTKNQVNKSLEGNFNKRKGFGKVKLSRITIDQPTFNIAQDISIYFELNSSEKLDDCLIFISLKNIQEIEVFYATNKYSNVFKVVELGLSKGKLIISPNYLMPGVYSLRFTINQGGTISDWIEDVIQFEINPVCDRVDFIPDYKVGFFHHPIKWHEIRNS